MQRAGVLLFFCFALLLWFVLTDERTRMVLIEKHYRGFLSRTVSDQFWKEASSYKNLRDTPPVIQKDKYVLAHVQVSRALVAAAAAIVLSVFCFRPRIW